jgi:hypothetical protein
VRHPRNLAPAAIAAVFLCAALTAAAEPPQTLTPLADKKSAPEIALDIVDGDKLNLSDLRGKVESSTARWADACLTTRILSGLSGRSLPSSARTSIV